MVIRKTIPCFRNDSRPAEGSALMDPEYARAIDLSRKIAAEVGTPRFYLEREREIALSRAMFSSEPLVKEGLRVIEEQRDCLGHGLTHVRKVATDVGALILIEQRGATADTDVRRLVLLAHLAALLHDIRRSEKNHAERGAEAAIEILASFAIRDDERAEIAGAIRNHEAFQPFRVEWAPDAMLLSDTLYDADKFRWGPDNFTETLWAMVIPLGIPLRTILPRFLSGLEGIRKIRGSFRTATGREYGPDFINRGLEIGRRLYRELMERQNPANAEQGGKYDKIHRQNERPV